MYHFILGFCAGVFVAGVSAWAYLDLLKELYITRGDYRLKNKTIISVCINEDTLAELDRKCSEFNISRSSLVESCIMSFNDIFKRGLENGEELSKDQFK